MTSRFCKWSSKTKADAYLAACNAEIGVIVGEPGAVWADTPRQDAEGLWTVALLGPPWQFIVGQPVDEPPACAALRVDATIADAPNWPAPEDA